MFKSICFSLPILVVFACAPKAKQTTNADLAAQFSGGEYEGDMVTTDTYHNVEDQGDAISPRVQQSIQTTIETAFIGDFERCLEKEMERLENVNIAGTFTLEVTIDTSGKVTAAKAGNLDVKERKALKAGAEAQFRDATEFGGCVEKQAMLWEFDPAPEAVYRHTYSGKVGEAW